MENQTFYLGIHTGTVHLCPTTCQTPSCWTIRTVRTLYENQKHNVCSHDTRGLLHFTLRISTRWIFLYNTVVKSKTRPSVGLISLYVFFYHPPPQNLRSMTSPAAWMMESAQICKSIASSSSSSVPVLSSSASLPPPITGSVLNATDCAGSLG